MQDRYKHSLDGGALFLSTLLALLNSALSHLRTMLTIDSRATSPNRPNQTLLR